MKRCRKEQDLSPCADCYNLKDYELYNKDRSNNMSENTITVNLNNLTSEEREQLLKLAKKSNTEKTKVWKPNEGDVYSYINSFGVVIQTKYDSRRTSNARHYETGNCFKTREEAKFAAEKQKLITEIKRYITENDPEELDWGNRNQYKYYIYYERVLGRLGSYYDITTKRMNTIYFSNKFNWEKMISDIGEDRIKKYLFGVENV